MAARNRRSTHGCFDCDDAAAAVVGAAGDEVVAEGDVEKFVQIRLIEIHCGCELHWMSGTVTVPLACHSKACQFAAVRLESEGNRIGHSVSDSALMLRSQRLGLLSFRHSVELVRSVHKHEAKASNYVEVTLGLRLWLSDLDFQLIQRFDASSLSFLTACPGDCRKIHIQATCFSGAMEGHFDCILIEGVGSSCGEVICPSMEICHSCKVN